MLISHPPAGVTPNLLMLGTGAYPLFLCKGDGEAAVFEGGTGAMGPVLRRQLGRLGIDTRTVRQVVLTHAHPDHVMAVPMLREMFPGVTVLASAPAAAVMSAEKAVAFFQKMDDALTASLLKAAVITEDDRPQPLAEPRIAVDRIIAEGDTVAVAGAASFTVLETPGHSDGSLSFHDSGGGALLISDATGYYLPDHAYWWPNYFTGYATYLASMRRLAGLGAEVLCLGHNAVLTGAEDVRSYFDGAIAATEAYHRRIVDETKAGKSVREIAEELGEEVYEKAPLLSLEFFQKNCGLLVKQSLRHEGLEPEK